MPRTPLLFSADTTCTTTHTNVVTFQALPSPLRVCGVSFVTVMSFSERCQCKKGTDKILRGDLQPCTACHCPCGQSSMLVYITGEEEEEEGEEVQCHKFMITELE